MDEKVRAILSAYRLTVGVDVDLDGVTYHIWCRNFGGKALANGTDLLTAVYEAALEIIDEHGAIIAESIEYGMMSPELLPENLESFVKGA